MITQWQWANERASEPEYEAGGARNTTPRLLWNRRKKRVKNEMDADVNLLSLDLHLVIGLKLHA